MRDVPPNAFSVAVTVAALACASCGDESASLAPDGAIVTKGSPEAGAGAEASSPRSDGGSLDEAPPSPTDAARDADASTVDACAGRKVCDDFERWTIGSSPGAP